MQADPIYDESFILNIVRSFVPDVGKVLRIDEQGGSARTYHIDLGVTLKVLRPNRKTSKDYIKREVFLLKQLEAAGVSNIPRSLGYGKDDALEYHCMSTIPGVAVRFSELTPTQRIEMLYKLGDTLYRVHHVPLESIYESELGFKSFTSDEEIRGQVWHYFNLAISKIAERLSPEQIDKALAEAEKHIAKINDTVPKLRHADPSDEHVFVDNGKFSGVIDFGDAYITHPAFDLRRWPHEDRSDLLKGYLSAGDVEDSFLDVCENIFAVENILDELRRKAENK